MALGVQDGCERGDVLGERAADRGGEGDKSLWLAGDEGLLKGDVARLLDRGQMRAEVAVGERELRLEIGEVHLLARGQMAERSHDLQARQIMDDWVEFWHGGDLAGYCQKKRT